MRRAREILGCATNIEQAGDIIDKNLLGIVSKAAERRGSGRRPSSQRSRTNAY